MSDSLAENDQEKKKLVFITTWSRTLLERCKNKKNKKKHVADDIQSIDAARASVDYTLFILLFLFYAKRFFFFFFCFVAHLSSF